MAEIVEQDLRIKGVKEETVSAWFLEAAPQMEQIEEVLPRDYKLSRAQLDALWTYVGHKGEKRSSRRRRARRILAVDVD